MSISKSWFSPLSVKNKEELNRLSALVAQNFWDLRCGVYEKRSAQSLSKNLLKLYAMDNVHGRTVFYGLLGRIKSKLIASRLFNPMLDIALKIPDNLSQKEITRFVIARGDVDSLNRLIHSKTNIPIDLDKKETIKPEHVRFMRRIVTHVGINLFALDMQGSRNILKLAGSSPEVVDALEKHILAKAKRYQNFWGLVHYVECFKLANHRRILTEVFKCRNSYRGNNAIQRIRNLPVFQKYFIMS